MSSVPEVHLARMENPRNFDGDLRLGWWSWTFLRKAGIIPVLSPLALSSGGSSG
ncbi:MAG: hypothetical protein U0936_04590 [Planctomycetaceae bacterium]